MVGKGKKLGKRAGKRSDAGAAGRLWPVVVVFLLAVFVRGLFLQQSRKNPTFSAPIVDAMTYDQMARNFADGGGPDERILLATHILSFVSVVCLLDQQIIYSVCQTRADSVGRFNVCAGIFVG